MSSIEFPYHRNDDDSSLPIRRFKLPSGEVVEIIYLKPITDEDNICAEGQITDLTLCPKCDRDLVYPIEEECKEVSPGNWEILLYCPNCEWSDLGVYNQATADYFDEKLDLGAESVMRDLRRLTRANMKEEASRFAEALENDYILPEDF